ncbi:MAG TPA: flavin reductase family protein [Rugosimonospora sp.]|nr:flavin reductase family protein [Rugosimonospora sp.]
MDTLTVDLEVVLHGVSSPAITRQAFLTFPTGVAAIAGLVDGVPVGMAVSSFTPVSWDPPLASVCMAVTSTTWPRLRRSGRLGVSVLSHGHQAACRQLAARGADRFAGLAWHGVRGGAVLLAGASAWFDCTVAREIRAGDHDLVLLDVHRLGCDPGTGPLVAHGSRLWRLADRQLEEG